MGLHGEPKARGGGDAVPSLTTSNAVIAVQPPCALRVPESQRPERGPPNTRTGSWSFLLKGNTPFRLRPCPCCT